MTVEEAKKGLFLGTGKYGRFTKFKILLRKYITKNPKKRRVLILVLTAEIIC